MIIFAIIVLIIYCTCKYHKNRNEEEDSGRFKRHYGKRQDNDDDYYRVKDGSGRKADYSFEDTPTPVKKYRVPASTRQYSNSELNKNE